MIPFNCPSANKVVKCSKIASLNRFDRPPLQEHVKRCSPSTVFPQNDEHSAGHGNEAYRHAHVGLRFDVDLVVQQYKGQVWSCRRTLMGLFVVLHRSTRPRESAQASSEYERVGTEEDGVELGGSSRRGVSRRRVLDTRSTVPRGCVMEGHKKVSAGDSALPWRVWDH